MQEQKIHLGKVTKDESDEIEYILERLAGLEELLLIIDDKSLEDTVQEEIRTLKTSSGNWWHTISEKYNWDVSGSDDWEIDFLTRAVRLIPHEL